MGPDTCRDTKWQRRAARAGFKIWKNRIVRNLSDADIERAFDGLSREHGISYIWKD